MKTRILKLFNPASVVLGLLALGSPLAAWATPTVSVGTVSGNPGAQVNLPINFTADASNGTSSIQFDITLPTGLTFVSISTGPVAD